MTDARLPEYTCADCCFWRRGMRHAAGSVWITTMSGGSPVVSGVCRALPPTSFNTVTDNPKSHWPRTLGDDWCGSHHPTEARYDEDLVVMTAKHEADMEALRRGDIGVFTVATQD